MALFPTPLVVGVGTSRSAAGALDAAIQLSVMTGSELHLVHASSPARPFGGGP